MDIVFGQVLILFLFALVGYTLCRKGVADSRQSCLLSCLEVYLFLPCKVFQTFSKNLTVDYISRKYQILLISVIILAILIPTAVFFSRFFSEKEYERKIYIYSLIVPNFGYMGYALTESLFGEEALINLMVFALPVQFFVYSVGYCMLTKIKFSFKKLLQPTLLAMAAGSVTGLLAVPAPEIIENFLTKAGNCMAPVSMVLTGMVISEFDLKKLLREKKIYIVTLLRLIVIPCCIAGVLNLFCNREIVAAAILLYAMPCGLNTIVFPRLVNENCEIGASLAFVSCIACCVTIPLCIRLFLS